MDKSKIENTTLEFKNYVNGFNDRHKKNCVKQLLQWQTAKAGKYL